MYRALDEHQFALQEQGADDYERCAKIKAWKMIIGAEHEALCLCPFQYAPYRRFGEEVRAQRLIPHLLCELLHNRHRPGKRLVPLLPLPTRVVRSAIWICHSSPGSPISLARIAASCKYAIASLVSPS